MTVRRFYGLALAVGFVIVAVADARGNKISGALACLAMFVAYFCISRSAA